MTKPTTTLPTKDITMVTDPDPAGPDYRYYDGRVTRPLDKGLVQSIETHGMLVPLRVTPVNGRYVLVDGRQRYRAALRIGLGMVPVDIVDTVEAREHAHRHASIANAMRSVDTAIDTAERIELSRSQGSTHAQACEDARVSARTGQNLLALLRLVPEVRELVRSGKLPLLDAYRIAKMKPETQAKAAAEAVRAAAAPKPRGKSGGKAKGGGNGNPDRQVLRFPADQIAALAVVLADAGLDDAADMLAWVLCASDEQGQAGLDAIRNPEIVAALGGALNQGGEAGQE